MSVETGIKNKISAKFSTKELSKLFNFNFNSSKDNLFSINTDSRTIKENEIFLPLKGEKFDGHNFINQVLDKRVKYSFCESSKVKQISENHRQKLIFVSSTLDAYHLIANYYRKKINPKVIAITGSSGKTTVKDLITSILSVKYKTHKSEANFNNEIGVPKTILEMPEDTQTLVLELAMRAKGEIAYLSKTVEPDIAVITNVGTAHIGILGSVENIVKAKCEILEYLKNNGLAIVHNSPSLVTQSRSIAHNVSIFDLNQANNISFKDGKSYFSLSGEEYFIPVLGEIHVLNSICAILISKNLLLNKEEIQKGLSCFETPKGRGNIVEIKNKVFIINESYNANPDSVKAAVCNLIECWDKNYKKILVLGELAELGEHKDKLLEDLNEWLKSKPLSSVITIGAGLDKIIGIRVSNIQECCAILKELLVSNTVVLVKGSRVAGLEKVIEYLKNKT